MSARGLMLEEATDEPRTLISSSLATSLSSSKDSGFRPARSMMTCRTWTLYLDSEREK